MTGAAVQISVWELLLAIATLLAAIVAMAWTLGRIILVQIEGRIADQFVTIVGRFTAMERLIDERFAAAREMRDAGNDLWQSRCAQCSQLLNQIQSEQQQELDGLRKKVDLHCKEFEDLRVHLAEQYVSKEAWLIGLGDLSSKLDRLAARVHA